MGMRVPILFVIGSLNVGGAEKHLLQVVPRLNRERWQPTVYCLTERGPLADELEALGVSVIGASSRLPEATNRIRRLISLCFSAWRLAMFMREFRPRIAHFFLPAAYILGAPASLLAQVPVRIMSRRSLNDYQKGHPLLRLAERILHPAMTAILGNSRSVVQQLHQQEAIAMNRLGLIYNGIDLEPFRSAGVRASMRRRLSIADNAIAFIIVANLIPYKGHHDLFTALGLAKHRLPPDWRLLVVGRDDGIGASLKALAQNLQIDKHVMFLGARQDVTELLMGADIGILSSHQEGFSNAILEGMAAGLPMIATDVGGNAEAVVDKETGLIVAARCAEQLSAAIELLASNSDLRRSMGEKGRVRVQQEFALSQCVRRYEALYEALMRGERLDEIAELGCG